MIAQVIRSLYALLQAIRARTKSPDIAGGDRSLPIGNLDIDESILIGKTGKILIRGWCLIDEHEPSSKGVVFVDGVVAGHLGFTELRPDVGAALPEYRWGEQAGFVANVPVRTGHGQHTIGVHVFNTDGRSHWLEKRVRILKPKIFLPELPSLGRLDIEDTIILTKRDTILIRGWCLIDEDEPPLRGAVFMDGKEIGPLSFTEARPDVHAELPEYGWGEQAGFVTEIPVGKRRGRCILRVRVSNSKGKSHLLEKEITILEPPTFRIENNIHKLHLWDKEMNPPRFEDIDNYPVQIYVELTTACNLSCIMCRNDIMTKAVPTNLFLDVNTFRKIDKILPFVTIISLAGWGESTLHRHFIDFMEHIHIHNDLCSIVFTSNFSVISDILIDAVIRYQVSNINISVDAASAEVYERIRRNGSFGRLMKNIERIEMAKQAFGVDRPSLSYAFVVQKANILELPQFVELVHNLGGHLIRLEHVCGMPDLEIDYSSQLDLYRQSMAKAEAAGILVCGSACEHFQRAERAQDHTNGDAHERESAATGRADTGQNGQGLECSNMKCYEPFQTVFINSDGGIVPCCQSLRSMGNLHRQSFEDIWFGEEYRTFRREMIECRFDPACANCIGVLAKNFPMINEDTIKALLFR